MKKLKRLWLGIPRPVRAGLNLLIILLLAVAFYVSIGAPTLTKVQAFRRAERANLVGPSDILLETELEHYFYSYLVLAETDEGVITYVSDNVWGPDINYHEKTGDITLVTAPKNPFDYGSLNWQVSFPVFVVDDYPQAVRAEVDLDIVGTYNHNLNGENLQEPLNHHYTLTSQREQDGFFRFSIELPFLESSDGYGNDTGTTHGADGYALDLLARLFTNRYTTIKPTSSASVTATVRLYDETDQLIVQRDLTIATE